MYKYITEQNTTKDHFDEISVCCGTILFEQQLSEY